MELISSVSFSELLLVSTVSMMLGGIVTSFFRWTEHPLAQAILNTTSMALKATEGVWKPALVALRPLGDFALSILKPLGPLALVVAKAFLSAIILVGEFVTKTVTALYTFGESLGLNMTQTGKALLYGAKDLASSLLTVLRALAFVITNTLSSMSYVIESFEMVGIYLRRLLFETHLVTWQDTLDIAIPFAIVTCLVSFVLWRAYNNCARPSAPWKKDDEYDTPRRSSRIARKRAMMLCYDASDSSLARKKPSARSTNL